jgi:hypothetical protein
MKENKIKMTCLIESRISMSLHHAPKIFEHDEYVGFIYFEGLIYIKIQ